MYLVKSLSRDKGSGRYTMYLPFSHQGICRAKGADTLYICQTPCPERGTLPDTWAILNTHRGKHRSGGAQERGLSLSRDAACNLERCIDSMWMLTTALLGSRLQGHECKRKTAEWSSEHASVLLSLSRLTYTAHSLFLHIDNTGYEPSR